MITYVLQVTGVPKVHPTLPLAQWELSDQTRELTKRGQSNTEKQHLQQPPALNVLRDSIVIRELPQYQNCVPPANSVQLKVFNQSLALQDFTALQDQPNRLNAPPVIIVLLAVICISSVSLVLTVLQEVQCQFLALMVTTAVEVLIITVLSLVARLVAVVSIQL